MDTTEELIGKMEQIKAQMQDSMDRFEDPLYMGLRAEDLLKAVYWMSVAIVKLLEQKKEQKG